MADSWSNGMKEKWVLVAQSCPTLCDPMDCSPPGSSILYPHGFSSKNIGVGCHALLQGIFPTQGSNPGLLHCREILYHLSHQRSPWIMNNVLSCFSRVRLFVTPWTIGPQAPLSRQKYWSRLPFPSPEDLPYPGIEPVSLMSPALADRFFTIRPPGKRQSNGILRSNSTGQARVSRGFTE